MKHYIRLIRPEQYIKNAFVFAPLFFGGSLTEPDLFLNTCIAFICFCLAASSIYILNDYLDVREDRAHPKKSLRPIASGNIATMPALVFSVILAASSLFAAYLVSHELTTILVGYIILNILYSKWLKHVAILDINIIAIGFVLRILAGSAVTAIDPSVWILLITYLLALFLGLAKRRTDVVLANDGLDVRKNIKGYNLMFVDTVMGLLSAIVLVCYIFYCISPEVREHYKSELLYVSIIFVLNGILRYLKLAIVDGSTYSPTLIVLKDRFIQVTIVLWIGLMCYLLYFN